MSAPTGRTEGRAPAASRDLAWPLVSVLLLSLALSLAISHALPLLDPDEGRNAEVAREMVANRDVVIPHLAGMPYLDKPPAFFWAVALSIARFGNTPLAARLPAMLAALLTLALVGRAGWRAGGTAFGLTAAALLAVAPLFAGLSAYVIFDLPLALCVTVVWLGLARELDAGATALRRLAMFLAIALGILLKGPVMLAWALGGSLGAALVLRSRAPLRWLAWIPGWIVALGLPALWFARATARFPEYPHYAFLEESLERMTRGTFHRGQPWWFVPAVLVGGALPWSLVTPWSRARLGRAAPEVARAALAGLGFAAFALVFFTLSRSKLVTYLVPALPPLAWTAAAMWTDAARRPAGRLALIGLVALLPAVLILGLPATSRLSRLDSGAPLARAIRVGGGGAVRYEGCYSYGTDFLLGRSSTLVSASGEETTSNYQVRYRDRLRARGLWTALDRAPDGDGARWIVRPRRSNAAPPPGFVEAFRDDRFVAFRSSASDPSRHSD